MQYFPKALETGLSVTWIL